jgi:hypothetical protein
MTAQINRPGQRPGLRPTSPREGTFAPPQVGLRPLDGAQREGLEGFKR